MLTLLLIDHGSGPAISLPEQVRKLRTLPGVGEVLVISNTVKPAAELDAGWIDDGRGIARAIKDAMAVAASKQVLLVSSLVGSSPNLENIVRDAAERSRSEHVYYPVAGMTDLPPFEAEFLVDIISRYESLPFGCILTSRVVLAEVAGECGESLATVMMKCLTEVTADGDFVTTSDLRAEASMPAMEIQMTLDDAGRAQCLATVVDRFDIEELFPNHPWKDFSSESAAAAYHTLAAMFIRFGDLESASGSLACSERLEESPRYFALKGLIASYKGELLGAVANMVSSLQCYEARKHNSGTHYLTFKPQDLEQVNSYLVDGLEALNTRDNERAFARFREAVRNFDGFYTELGIIEGE